MLNMNKLTPLEKYILKMIRATAGMHGKQAVLLNLSFEGYGFGDPTFEADVGNHEKYCFEGEGLYATESPYFGIYDNSKVIFFYLPNPYMISETALRNALREYFGTIWETTWEEWISHKKELQNKHWSGYYRYYIRQRYIHITKKNCQHKSAELKRWSSF